MLVIILLALLSSFPSFAQTQGTKSIDGGDAQCPVNIPGITHHGNCNLLCRPASWTDILVFYLVNYVAHAATIITRPGQSILTSLFTIAIALLLPGGGVRCGIQAIFNFAKFADTDLQVAARAGALCAVVRIRDALPDPQQNGHAEEGSPAMENDEGIEMEEMRVDLQVLRPKEESRKILATKIHGLCRLPEGYDLVVVPRTATFERDDQGAVLASPSNKRLWRWLTAPFRVEAVPLTVVCCSYNIIRIFVSLAQLGFAIATMYRTRGDQIDLYGYAAFGLTVAPYAWMSFINLAGNIMCPQYDTMFVVESSSLDRLRADAEAAGASDSFMVTGTVGRLTVQAEAELRRYYAEVQSRFQSYDSSGAVYAAVVPIAIIGGLSHFSPGQTALYQRLWTMMWLVFGCTAGGAVGQIADHIEGRPVLGSTRHLHRFGFWFIPIIIALFYAAAPIGGYIVVGRMIKEFGVCYEFKNIGSGVEGS